MRNYQLPQPLSDPKLITGDDKDFREMPPLQVTYVTKSDFEKIQIIYQRLHLIWERDGVADQFRGSGHYLIRSVIEAMNLSELFYEKKTDD